jgi:peptidyl-prolyl cis-trans isomerase C
MRKIVALMALVAICTTSLLFAQTQASPVVMTVNDQPVFFWEMRLVLPQVQMELASRGVEQTRDLMLRLAAKKVVESKLLAQEARRRNYNPSSEAVDAAIKGIEVSAGGRDRLDATLKELGATYDDLRANVEETEAVKLLVARDFEPKVTVTPQEVAAFYDDNPDVFMQPDRVRARHILTRVNPNDPEAAKKAARSRIETAHKRVLAGEDFAAVATEMSDGPNAAAGGDLGFFAQDSMVPVLANAAFALDVGEVSDIIESQFGFHIVKILAKKPAGTLPFAEAKGPAEQLLKENKMGEMVTLLIRELTESATIIQTTQPAATTGD